MVSIGTISYLGSHGTELLRAGWTESVLDPGIEDWVRRIHEFGREADTSDLRRRRVRLEDKGVGIKSFLEGADIDVVMYVGDDATDLDAFRALTELVEEGRVSHAIRVGVRSDEGPTQITEQADVVVDGTEGVQELLALLVSD